jgi:hypothetical protein
MPMNSSDETPPTPLATKLGFGLWAISLIWWFFYYAQYGGAFGLMDLKLACVSFATRECAFFQQNIRGPVPTYWPLFWYAGMVAFAVGVYQTWQQRKK